MFHTFFREISEIILFKLVGETWECFNDRFMGVEEMTRAAKRSR